MKTIEEILYKNSNDTSDGLEIDFTIINKVIVELKQLQEDKIKNCVLHMLNYCFENVGKDTNINEEINKWIKNDDRNKTVGTINQ